MAKFLQHDLPAPPRFDKYRVETAAMSRLPYGQHLFRDITAVHERSRKRGNGQKNTAMHAVLGGRDVPTTPSRLAARRGAALSCGEARQSPDRDILDRQIFLRSRVGMRGADAPHRRGADTGAARAVAMAAVSGRTSRRPSAAA